MQKKILILSLTFILLSLSSCQNKQTPKADDKVQAKTVSFCIDILGPREPIFTEPVTTALMELAKTDIRLIKQICKEKSEYSQQLMLCANQSDLIIAGPLMAEELTEVAAKFPDKFFILLDFPAKGKNIASIIFSEEDMAKRALTICLNNSKTKKIGALFMGVPDSPLSVVLTHSLQPARIDFVKVFEKSSEVLKKIRSWEKEQIDFIFIDKAPYLEETISSLSKDKTRTVQIVCPRIILPPDQLTPVLATIEKNYKPILTKLVTAFLKEKNSAQIYLVNDFISVLTR